MVYDHVGTRNTYQSVRLIACINLVPMQTSMKALILVNKYYKHSAFVLFSFIKCSSQFFRRCALVCDRRHFFRLALPGVNFFPHCVVIVVGNYKTHTNSLLIYFETASNCVFRLAHKLQLHKKQYALKRDNETEEQLTVRSQFANCSYRAYCMC